jgi:SAM-dependent methyltransferase
LISALVLLKQAITASNFPPVCYNLHMRKQQEIWLKEHTDNATLPTMANTEPVSEVLLFTDWLKGQGISFSGKAVDIGCGKGRNSVYLASCGYEVWAMDYIKPAIASAKTLAINRCVADKIHFSISEIDRPWKIANDSFELAVDSFSSIDIETKHGREICRDEMHRTLKPNGYALVAVCSNEDEWEKKLIADHPGTEPNSTIWPQNGKFQKDYSAAELCKFYDKFEVVEIRTIRKPAFKIGSKGTATNLWLVLRKL